TDRGPYAEPDNAGVQRTGPVGVIGTPAAVRVGKGHRADRDEGRGDRSGIVRPAEYPPLRGGFDPGEVHDVPGATARYQNAGAAAVGEGDDVSVRGHARGHLVDVQPLDGRADKAGGTALPVDREVEEVVAQSEVGIVRYHRGGGIEVERVRAVVRVRDLAAHEDPYHPVGRHRRRLAVERGGEGAAAGGLGADVGVAEPGGCRGRTGGVRRRAGVRRPAVGGELLVPEVTGVVDVASLVRCGRLGQRAAGTAGV